MKNQNAHTHNLPQVKAIGPNMIELSFPVGGMILYSYATPVAVWTGHGPVEYAKGYGPTTGKQINKWVAAHDFDKVEVSEERIAQVMGNLYAMQTGC